MEELSSALRARLEALGREHPDELISVLDSGGNNLFVSESLIAILGYSPRSWVGKKAGRFVVPEDIHYLSNAMMEAMQLGKSVEAIARVIAHDGATVRLRGTLTKINVPEAEEPVLLARMQVVD